MRVHLALLLVTSSLLIEKSFASSELKCSEVLSQKFKYKDLDSLYLNFNKQRESKLILEQQFKTPTSLVNIKYRSQDKTYYYESVEKSKFGLTYKQAKKLVPKGTTLKRESVRLIKNKKTYDFTLMNGFVFSFSSDERSCSYNESDTCVCDK